MRPVVTWRDGLLAFFSIAALVSSAAAQEGRGHAEATARPAGDAAAAAGRTPANPIPPDPARMKRLLRVWEQRSAELQTLDVEIQRIDRRTGWADERFKGRAILKSPNLAWLDFKKEAEDPKKKQYVLVDYERIICTGTEVWQYRSDAKQILVFPLDRQSQNRALEEGPLPFLFNMKAAAAEARYKMDLVKETPENYIISVVPLLKIDQEAFSKAFLQLSKRTYLPDRIFLFSPNGKDTKDFTLTKVRPNEPVAMANFKGVRLPKPWVTRFDPGGEGQNQPAPPGGQDVGNRPPPNPAQRRR
jgi:TIGR03009 family protein